MLGVSIINKLTYGHVKNQVCLEMCDDMYRFMWLHSVVLSEVYNCVIKPTI